MAGLVPGLVGAAAGCPAHRGGPGEARTKERQMTSNPRPGTCILGSLRSAEGKRIVRAPGPFLRHLGAVLDQPAVAPRPRNRKGPPRPRARWHPSAHGQTVIAAGWPYAEQPDRFEQARPRPTGRADRLQAPFAGSQARWPSWRNRCGACQAGLCSSSSGSERFSAWMARSRSGRSSSTVACRIA